MGSETIETWIPFPAQPLHTTSHKITLLQGDALDILPAFPTASAGAIIIDPPYSMVPNSVRGRDDGAAGSSGAPMRLLSEAANQARRILTPGGIAAFVCDWRRVPDISYLITLTGLRITTCIAWTRTTVGTGGMFRGGWDPIIIASNGTPNVVDRAAIPNVVTANPPPPARRRHPYQKPEALWDHILQRIPPTHVIDAFCGSAASAPAALRSGHTWTGIEVDANYCTQTAQWLNDQRLGV